MPPSCRVRRGVSFSSYTQLEGSDAPDRRRSPSITELGQTTESPTLQRARSKSIQNYTIPASPSRPRSKTLSSLFSKPDEGWSSSLGRKSSPALDNSPSVPRRPGLVTSHLASHRSRLSLRASEHPVSRRPSEVVVPTGENESTKSLLEDEHHDDDIVEHLEVIDPHVSVVSHLSNAANSILIPPMSSLYSRRPVIDLPVPPDDRPHDMVEKGRSHVDEIDLHVEHVLRKRDKLRRTAAGIWSFLKTPMGIITAIYGFCVVFWGAAIVIFLAGWIPMRNADRKWFWVEVSSQVENALFTVTGVGLIPWRAVDTYRMFRIWNYKRITCKRRSKAGLPQLYDEDDLPDPTLDPKYVHVLSDRQQKDLHHQQKQFAKSQTWYRPHGTETHRAFPIWTALLICVFVDGNSFFQVILCGCMWGLDRFRRPAWTTATLIPASFACGIVAAILIWKGGQKTKRTKVVEEKLRAALEKDPVPPTAAVEATNGDTSAKHARGDIDADTKQESRLDEMEEIKEVANTTDLSHS